MISPVPMPRPRLPAPLGALLAHGGDDIVRGVPPWLVGACGASARCSWASSSWASRQLVGLAELVGLALKEVL